MTSHPSFGTVFVFSVNTKEHLGLPISHAVILYYQIADGSMHNLTKMPLGSFLHIVISDTNIGRFN